MADPPVHNSENPLAGCGWRGLVDAALSLQCKATVLVVVLTLSVTAAVTGYLLRASVRLLAQQRDEKMVQLTAMAAKAAAAALASGDVEALQSLAEETVDGVPLTYVAFLDIEGHELAAAWGEPAGARVPFRSNKATPPAVTGTPVFRPTSANAPAYLDIIYPINFPATGRNATCTANVPLVGYVRAGMLAGVWQRSIVSKLDLLVGLGALAIVVAIPLGFLVVRRIVSPLEGLAETMQRFSQGKLDVRSTAGRRDEIGRLAGAFNRMADQHQQTHERIVRLNAELENRVARRTRQLRELAAREPLTGLYNRRRLSEMLEHCLSEALRYDNDLSCIMIDLDDFKAVNDAFGHAVGDQVLVLAAETMRGQLRAADVPARYGGDEFIVLLPQTGSERARVLAERIVEKFAEEISRTLPNVHTGMSVGIAALQALDTRDAASLIRAADSALYQAKAAGKDTVVTAADGVATTPIGLSPV